eukprot:TRINITY_DN2037_c0_g1_i3.p1 TRINITY_DN2037_c0_g1~~TRINITY_DN2037_c0_g1_i3.p1  ORF type:complete len:166 (-),score=47.94 TRINITY_DN2037_c0_g1_i3:85-582(-)
MSEMDLEDDDKALSKNVLSMKFMHRVKQQEERRNAEKARHMKDTDNEWMVENPILQRLSVQISRDEVSLAANLGGRRSFMGFNPAVQKLNEEQAAKRSSQKSAPPTPVSSSKSTPSKTGTLAVEEMAKRYQALISRGPSPAHKKANPSAITPQQNPNKKLRLSSS